MIENEISPNNSVSIINQNEQFTVLQRQCIAFIASGFLPSHITQGVDSQVALAKALTIAIKGRELGIPPMQAFSSISVIKGKPCLSSELMLALCYQRVKGFGCRYATTPDRAHLEATIFMWRGGQDPQEFRFTIEDAKTAGLVLPNSAWIKYPPAMLRARVVSAGARVVCPDAIMGCYTPEEMGATVIVDVEDSIETVVESKSEEPPKKKSYLDTVPTENKGMPQSAMELGFDSPTTHKKAIEHLRSAAKKGNWTNNDMKICSAKNFSNKTSEQLTWLELNEFIKMIVSQPKGFPPSDFHIGSDDDIRSAISGN
jgi:hypothetical protein